MGPPEDRHKIPMVIFDGKGDLEFFQELLPYIHRAGRLDDLRLINPARPELSSLYNPFYAEDDDYMAQVNMVFGSFNLHDEFFSKHQLNYLADIVRILHYTGVRFNFYDVIVAVLDQGVLQEQIDKATDRAAAASPHSSPLMAVLGDYATTADFTTFLKKDRVGSGPSDDIANLAGARLVSSIEVDDGRQLAQAPVKQLTGGDVVRARHLYQGSFEYRPQFALWLVCNRAPAVAHDDDAMWRRILRLPFDNKIPAAKHDKNPEGQVNRRVPDRPRNSRVGGARLRRMVSARASSAACCGKRNQIVPGPIKSNR
jgi:hypothetical protein